MPDFRSKAEQQNDQYRQQVETHNYKTAFEKSQSAVSALKTQIDTLKAEITDLKSTQSQFRTQMETMAQTHAEHVRALRGQIETGLTKLDEDNQKLHTLIRSGQDHDLKLTEQMDENHRERMSNIQQLLDQKALPDG